jgi:hypothetical protein
MKHSKRRIAIIASTTAAVLLGGGIAAAYWTSTGGGSGTASVGTSGTVTVTQTGPAIVGLYPDGPVTPITFDVSNNGTSPVVINHVNVSIAPTSLPLNCAAGNFTIVNGTPANTSVGTTPVGSGAWGTYSIQLTDNGTNQDACKGASLVLNFSAA